MAICASHVVHRENKPHHELLAYVAVQLNYGPFYLFDGRTHNYHLPRTDIVRSFLTPTRILSMVHGQLVPYRRTEMREKGRRFE